ncbi:MAG: hypothetical protein WEE89_13930 [Gemmatimonadota bacterium]
MRSAEADYDAIEAALHTHQVHTLHDLALAAGLAPRDWWKHTLARVLAKDLAVANVVERLCGDGVPRRQAINRAASQFNLDTETLQRRYRGLRQRHHAD